MLRADQEEWCISFNVYALNNRTQNAESKNYKVHRLIRNYGQTDPSTCLLTSKKTRHTENQ